MDFEKKREYHVKPVGFASFTVGRSDSVLLDFAVVFRLWVDVNVHMGWWSRLRGLESPFLMYDSLFLIFLFFLIESSNPNMYYYYQQNSTRLARLEPDMPDATRLPYLVWRHNDAPGAIKFSCTRS
jgi:hypothetical protein